MSKYRDLPSLNLLRSFEAVARSASVTQAAAELHVTQSAVSHQVKALEAWLGVPLLERSGRSIRLTVQGAAYFPVLRSALDAIDQATFKVRSKSSRQRLAVSVLPTFGSQWLIPRLADFCAQSPGVDVQISTTGSVLDFDPAEHDIAIRCLSEEDIVNLRKRPEWKDVEIVPFLPDGMTVVCSPSLLAKHPLPWSAAQWAKLTLLHSKSTPMAWSAWLASAGLNKVKANKAVTFDHGNMAVLAAGQGMGLAMTAPAMCADAVASGLLAVPFPDHVIFPKQNCWICHPRTAQDKHTLAFKQWLKTA